MATPAGARLSGEQTVDNLDTGCLPMEFHVNLWGDSEGNEDLERILRIAGRSRLRAAGVFNADAWDEYGQYLLVSLGTYASANSTAL